MPDILYINPDSANPTLTLTLTVGSGHHCL